MKIRVPVKVTVPGYVVVEYSNSSSELEERVDKAVKEGGFDEVNTTGHTSFVIDWEVLVSAVWPKLGDPIKERMHEDILHRNRTKESY